MNIDKEFFRDYLGYFAKVVFREGKTEKFVMGKIHALADKFVIIESDRDKTAISYKKITDARIDKRGLSK